MLDIKNAISHAPEGAGSGSGEPKTYSEEEFNKVVSQRQEAKEKIKELESSISSINTKLKEFEEADSIKKGDYEKIINDLKSENTSLKSKLDESEKKAGEWDNYQSSKRKTLIDKIPEADRLESFNVLPLGDLEKLVDKFSVKPPIDVDGGNGKPPKPTELTEAEKEQAKKMGLSEDGFKLFKKRQEELKTSKEKK